MTDVVVKPAGPFSLSIRMYLPGPTILSGDYVLPPVERVNG